MSTLISSKIRLLLVKGRASETSWCTPTAACVRTQAETRRADISTYIRLKQPAAGRLMYRECIRRDYLSDQADEQSETINNGTKRRYIYTVRLRLYNQTHWGAFNTTDKANNWSAYPSCRFFCWCAPLRGCSVALVDVCTRTTIETVDKGCDDTYGCFCCDVPGCLHETPPDGSHVDYVCWICEDDTSDFEGNRPSLMSSFGEPQDLVEMRIEFYDGHDSNQVLELYANGEYHSEIEITDDTTGYRTFDVNTKNTSELTIYGDHPETYADMWLYIREVRPGGSSTQYTLVCKAMKPQPLQTLSAGCDIAEVTFDVTQISRLSAVPVQTPIIAPH